MFDTLKLVFDTFGKDLMVPVMIFIICMIFKAPAKKAFSWLEMAQICAIILYQKRCRVWSFLRPIS